MPRLIRRPEDIIRATGGDIFLIHFTDGAEAYEAGREPEGYADLVNWLATHQPHVIPELIGPSEFSGWVCGGICWDLYLNWTEGDVVAFSADWENLDGGSVDSRFQCYRYPVATYERRLAEHGDARTWND